MELTEEELTRIITEAVRAEIARILPTLPQIMAQIMAEQGQQSAPQLSELDRFIAGTVSEIWRDQGKRPATTKAVSVRMGYSPDHTLRLLKDARDNGAIVEVPGRGTRCSGKFVPLARNVA